MDDRKKIFEVISDRDGDCECPHCKALHVDLPEGEHECRLCDGKFKMKLMVGVSPG